MIEVGGTVGAVLVRLAEVVAFVGGLKLAFIAVFRVDVDVAAMTPHAHDFVALRRPATRAVSGAAHAGAKAPAHACTRAAASLNVLLTQHQPGMLTMRAVCACSAMAASVIA